MCTVSFHYSQPIFVPFFKVHICFHFFSLSLSVPLSQLVQDQRPVQINSQTIARATRSGVIGPVLTEIHKSSVLDEFFFFFVSDLAVAMESPQQQQQQQPLAWRQQQQWQHTTTVVRRTSRGRVKRTTRQTVL